MADRPAEWRRCRREAAQHERAFAADDHQADARRQRDAERGQDQRRRCDQRVLQRERRAEAAALHEIERNPAAICPARARKIEKAIPESCERETGNDDVFGAAAKPDGEVAPVYGRRRGRQRLRDVGHACYELPARFRERAHSAVRCGELPSRRTARRSADGDQVMEPWTPSSRIVHLVEPGIEIVVGLG